MPNKTQRAQKRIGRISSRLTKKVAKGTDNAKAAEKAQKRIGRIVRRMNN